MGRLTSKSSFYPQTLSFWLFQALSRTLWYFKKLLISSLGDVKRGPPHVYYCPCSVENQNINRWFLRSIHLPSRSSMWDTLLSAVQKLILHWPPKGHIHVLYRYGNWGWEILIYAGPHKELSRSQDANVSFTPKPVLKTTGKRVSSSRPVLCDVHWLRDSVGRYLRSLPTSSIENVLSFTYTSCSAPHYSIKQGSADSRGPDNPRFQLYGRQSIIVAIDSW